MSCGQWTVSSGQKLTNLFFYEYSAKKVEIPPLLLNTGPSP